MKILAELAHWFPVWNTTRAAGFVSYVLLFISMVAGFFQSLRLGSAQTRSAVNVVHSTSAWLGLLFGMVHGLVLLFDRYVGYSIADILVPFATNHAPFETASGIIAFYILLLLVVTSDLMKPLGKKIWKSIHYLAVPGYILALYHGVSLGTDSRAVGIMMVYIVTAVFTIILGIVRVIFAFRTKTTRTRF